MLIYSKLGGIAVKNEIPNRRSGNVMINELVYVTRNLLQRGGRSMEELGIGIGQLPILKFLREEGTMTQRQLAEKIRVTPATVSGTLKRMEKSGMIRRCASEEDARVSCVSLTEQGKCCCDEADERFRALFYELMNGFEEEECRILENFILRMSENLKSADVCPEGETNE